MRVLLISAEYPPTPGGVGDYTRQLALALEAAGHEPLVLTGASPARRDDEPWVLRQVPAWGWGLHAEIHAVAHEQRADVLHLQYQSGAYHMHPAINMLRPRSRRPLVATFHDLYMPYLLPKARPLRRWVTRKLLDSAHAVVVTNQQDRALLEGGPATEPTVYAAARPLRTPVELIPIGSNIEVAPPQGYDRALLRTKLGVRPEELLVAYFGLLSPSKGADQLLRALELLPPHIKLLIVGGEAHSQADRAYAAELRREIERPTLKGRVRLTGQLSEAQVSAHLLAADAAALPFVDGVSYRRGSLLAALLHGLPTISTAPQQPQTPDPSKALLLVPPKDTRALASAILELDEDPTRRRALAEAGRTLAEHFRWPAIAASHIALYERLLARGA